MKYSGELLILEGGMIMRRANVSFFIVVLLYILLMAGALVWFGWFCESRTSGIISGLIIGSIYVLITFYYFYQNYLAPYGLEHPDSERVEERSLILWVLSWFIPALLLQIFVVFGFFLTVDRVNLSDTMYTHPFMYGQTYKKMLATSDLAEANLLKNDPANQDANKETRLKYLEDRFSSFVRNYISRAEVPTIDEPGGFKSKLEEILEEIERLDNQLLKLQKNKQKLYAVQKSKKERQERIYEIAVQRIDPRAKLENRLHAIPYLIALTFGFLGALIYSLLDIVNRNSNSDLHIKTLINYLVRFIFSLAICLVIAYFFMSNWQSNIAPMVFFLCGIFPQQALGYIVERARRSLRLEKRQYEEIPLEVLQGMTDYIAFRFRELGIGDAQNLAFCNVKRISDNLGFSDSMISDFVAQAMLVVYMKDDFRILRSKAIRDIFCLNDLLEKEKKKLRPLAEFLQIEEEKLLVMTHVFEDPAVQARIKELREMKELSEK